MDGKGFACDHRWCPDRGDGGRRHIAGGLDFALGGEVSTCLPSIGRFQMRPLLKWSAPQQGLADEGAGVWASSAR